MFLNLTRKQISGAILALLLSVTIGLPARAAGTVKKQKLPLLMIVELDSLYRELHRILHRLPASGVYWRLLAIPMNVYGSD